MLLGSFQNVVGQPEQLFVCGTPNLLDLIVVQQASRKSGAPVVALQNSEAIQRLKQQGNGLGGPASSDWCAVPHAPTTENVSRRRGVEYRRRFRFLRAIDQAHEPVQALQLRRAGLNLRRQVR